MFASGIMTFLFIVYTVAAFILYHKCFTVYYTNALMGIGKELIIAAFCGGIMAAITISFWYVAAIIIIIAGLILSSKAGNKGPLVLCIIFAIIVAIAGINANSIDTASINSYITEYITM